MLAYSLPHMQYSHSEYVPILTTHSAAVAHSVTHVIQCHCHADRAHRTTPITPTCTLPLSFSISHAVLSANTVLLSLKCTEYRCQKDSRTHRTKNHTHTHTWHIPPLAHTTRLDLQYCCHKLSHTHRTTNKHTPTRTCTYCHTQLATHPHTPYLSISHQHAATLSHPQ
jgi:hypothetical protein